MTVLGAVLTHILERLLIVVRFIQVQSSNNRGLIGPVLCWNWPNVAAYPRQSGLICSFLNSQSTYLGLSSPCIGSVGCKSAWNETWGSQCYLHCGGWEVNGLILFCYFAAFWKWREVVLELQWFHEQQNLWFSLGLYTPSHGCHPYRPSTRWGLKSNPPGTCHPLLMCHPLHSVWRWHQWHLGLEGQISSFCVPCFITVHMYMYLLTLSYPCPKTTGRFCHCLFGVGG